MDSSKIIIVDNFFDDKNVSIIRSKIKDSQYQNNHNSIDAEYEYSWQCSHLLNDYFFNNILLKKFENRFNKKIMANRIYINSMVYGNEGAFHIDSDLNNSYTLLYFIDGPQNYEETDKFGGYFYYKENIEIKCIEPIHNRLILFKSDIFHKGSHYNKFVNKIRYSIAWKTIIE